MFGTIRKHQNWLWAIIITVVIVSFVMFFSPYQKMDRGGRTRSEFGSINGEPVTREDYLNAAREVRLRYFFMNGGRWPDDDRQSGFDPDQETYQWLLLLNREKEAGVHVSPELVAQTGRQMLDNFQRGGITSADVFFTRVLEPKGLSLDDFERYVRHTLGIQELISVAGLGGKLITPEQAREFYTRENQEISTEAFFFSASNYLANVTVNPEAVMQFYSNRQSFYRLPERMRVTYVKFGVSNYLAQAEADLTKTNLAELVDLNMQRLGTNYLRLADTPEQAKVKIREELIRTHAFTEARRKASEFATQLFNLEPAKPENLENLAREKGLTAELSEPFDRRNGPKGLEVDNAFATAAFGLNPTNEPFSPPVAGDDGVYVVAYNARIPSELPTFDQISEKVAEDYRHDQAIIMARSVGMAAHRTITNALAAGKSLTAAAEEVKIAPVTLPPFSLTTRSLPQAEAHITINELKQIAFATAPGKLSDFTMTADGGVILFVKAKLPVDETKLVAELPRFLTALRQQRQTELFNDWFRKQAERGLRDTPLNRPKAPPPSVGGSQPVNTAAKS
jgi:hypothetical protein